MCYALAITALSLLYVLAQRPELFSLLVLGMVMLNGMSGVLTSGLPLVQGS